MMTSSTPHRVKKLFACDLRRMSVANNERGDSWRDIGALGLFLEVRTMYLRLRGLLWDQMVSLVDGDCGQVLDKIALRNALQDLRNYAALLELAIDDDLIGGSRESDEKL